MAKRRSPLLWMAAAAVFLVLAAGTYGALIRPMVLGFTQVQNLSLMHNYVWHLEEYKRAHGSYPERLGEATRERPVFGRPIEIGQDLWNHPLSYRKQGAGFLLVSFGRDGKPDGTDYEALRSSQTQDETPCRNPDADQIVSEKGWHRSCGK